MGPRTRQAAGQTYFVRLRFPEWPTVDVARLAEHLEPSRQRHACLRRACMRLAALTVAMPAWNVCGQVKCGTRIGRLRFEARRLVTEAEQLLRFERRVRGETA